MKTHTHKQIVQEAVGKILISPYININRAPLVAQLAKNPPAM